MLRFTPLIVGVVVLLPALALAQSPPVSSSSSAGTVPVATAAAVQPRSIAVPRNTSGVVRTVTPKPVVSPSLSVMASTSAPNSGNFGLIATATTLAVSVGILVLGLLRKNDQQKDDKNDNRCDSIKSLLDQKKQELEDMVRGWPSNKAQDVAKDKILEQLAKNEKIGEVVGIAAELKEKYDKLQEATEKLQQRYDLCIISLTHETERQVIIIHGCPDDEERAMNPESRTYNKHWMPWLKKNLEEKGIKTEAPLMPNPWKPNYEAYKKELEKHNISENSILIGHSCGSAFIVRWLGDSKRKIKKLILVAPWAIAYGNDVKRAFYTFTIDPSIKDRVNEIIIFTSDDEEEDGKKSAKIFHDALGGRLIELQGRGHYNIWDMETEEFPELLQEVLK